MAVTTRIDSSQRRRPTARPGRKSRVPISVLVLGLIALSLMLLDLQGGVTGPLRQAGIAVGGPIQSWANGALGALPTLSEQRINTDELQQNLIASQQRESELQLQLDQLKEQLDRKVADPAVTELATISAAVVAAGPLMSRNTLTVAAGRNDGVTPDTAVLSGNALVGRVVDVGPTNSTVQLITDPASSIAVRLQGSRELALAVGGADQQALNLELFDPLVDVELGQRVITVGSPEDRPFPAGLLVGSVNVVNGAVGAPDRNVNVQPEAKLTALDEVQLLLPDGDGAREIRQQP